LLCIVEENVSVWPQSLPRLVRGGARIFCPALAAQVDPVKNIALKAHYFKSFFHSIQQAGQAVGSGHLSLNVCLWPK
jgi:hypothetical protein